MPFSFRQLKLNLRRLNWREKVFLGLLVQQLVYRLYFRFAGEYLPFQFPLTFLFVVLAVLLGLDYLRQLIRPMLWSLRNRLMVTYVFIGVVPLLLILATIAIGMYVLMGQVATHLVSSEIRSRQLLVMDAAAAMAWEAAGSTCADLGEGNAAQFMNLLQNRLPGLEVIIQCGQNRHHLPDAAGMRKIPEWSQPGYMGVVIVGPRNFLAAHATVTRAQRTVSVFAYEPLSPRLLSNLLPDLGLVQFVELSELQPLDKGGEEEKGVMFRREENGMSSGKAEELMALPPAARWWDLEINWWTFLTLQQWDSPAPKIWILQVVTRPTLVFRHIFKTFDLTGAFSATLKWVSLALFALLLAAIYISVYAGVRMTRSITHAAADLDVATGKIDLGDFSHRIPIRSNDQLSKLALSFNQMTENIQRLIAEVKEKEKLESELVIAREVQAQLFPKSTPRLKTLELAGYCSPARTVSGDYYDFVPVDSRQTALAIGDIAGKGISAALLMAAIQSSLRAQLTFHGSLPSRSQVRDVLLSTAQLVATMNLQLYESTTPEKFASFCLGVYDDQSGRMLYTNAGHLPPILIRQGEACRLEISGMVLGVLPNALYDQNVVQLEPGDLLVAFTDGITEPENEYGEEFGDARLIDLLVRHSRKPLEELATLVTSTVGEWARDPDQRDDMTLLLARRI